MEDQICTSSSIFSCDPSAIHKTEVLIHIDQKLRLALGVSSVYLCQFVADVALRQCSIRDRTFLFEMQPNIESGQTLRGSTCPHLRALLINLKDSSKQANELAYEPHTALLRTLGHETRSGLCPLPTACGFPSPWDAFMIGSTE